MSGDGPASEAQEEAAPRRGHLLSAVMREGERVTPLELFFDLVFVLALTQCTTLMASAGSWGGLLKGLLVLGMLWWSWVGYAWLTSVVNPEEGLVRLVMFLAMAAFLIASLCVPRAFGNDALAFALAYAVVRVAHILLFLLASREDVGLRRAVVGLAGSTTIGAGLLLVAAFTGGALQVALWGLAFVLDVSGPIVIEPAGWRLVPGHFAERHGAIVIIALGESIVAVGLGAHARVDAGVVAAAVLALAAAACLWWAYFDVAAIVSAEALAEAEPGREQNRIARDAYSYLHFPMVAGIALLAVGLRQTLAHLSASSGIVPAFALLGGAALFLLALVVFRLRVMHTLSVRRLVCGGLLLVALALHAALSAIALLGLLTAVLVAMIGYEALRYADSRERVRQGMLEGA